MKLEKINLKMFFSEKDFFTNAFDEAYNISKATPDAPESSEPVSNEVIEETQANDETIVENPSNEPKELSPEEIKELYSKHFGNEVNEEPQLDEETQTALELYRYLEQNNHLVQAMREYDANGHKELNKFVPDEITRELNDLKEFRAEYEYNKYISDLKSKYPDFDEDKVLEFAEKTDVVDLEVCYKAMKAESVQEPDMNALREQIKQELLNELKQNSINTQSLVGTVNQKPINNSDEVSLSSKEQRIANAMGIAPSEYAKWR